jgi:hypothetical protein
MSSSGPSLGGAGHAAPGSLIGESDAGPEETARQAPNEARPAFPAEARGAGPPPTPRRAQVAQGAGSSLHSPIRAWSNTPTAPGPARGPDGRSARLAPMSETQPAFRCAAGPPGACAVYGPQARVYATTWLRWSVLPRWRRIPST